MCACSHWTRTVFLRGSDEDYTMTTRSRLLERLRVILAGRATEEVVLAHSDCCMNVLGPAEDIQALAALFTCAAVASMAEHAVLWSS